MSKGIQEQLEETHVHKYNHLTTELANDFLMEVFYPEGREPSAEEYIDDMLIELKSFE